MPVDFSGRDELLFGDPNKPIFGDTPIYSRPRKSRGFGFSKPATAATTASAPRMRGETALGSGAIASERVTRKSNGIPAVALIAAPAAIVLLGGAFLLMQPREPAPTDTLTVAAAEPATPVPVAPELAPAAPTPETAGASVNPAATAPVEKVATPAPARAEAAPRATQVARARPAPRAPTVEDLATEASATAPAATSSAPASSMAVTPAPLDIPSVSAPMTVDPAAVNPPAAPTGPTGAAPAPVPDASAVTP